MEQQLAANAQQFVFAFPPWIDAFVFRNLQHDEIRYSLRQARDSAHLPRCNMRFTDKDLRHVLVQSTS
jgi:hypothetical protein